MTMSGIPSPFPMVNGLDHDDFCEAAYEVFFTACRSSPGFGKVGPILQQKVSEGVGDGIGSGPFSPTKPPKVGIAVTSKVKSALGLKMQKRVPISRRSSSCGEATAFTSMAGKVRPRRLMTSAEIMRQQMRVTELSDNRLHKTLMKTLVGQISRRAETIVLPLELLRHLKPSEFNDAQEYHLWQIRQLKFLEAGLVLHPSIPLHKSNTYVAKLRDIIKSSETKPIDVGKNSETMKTLVNCVSSLAWRGRDGEKPDVPHWADGYPISVQIYRALLFSVFDLKDKTVVLDEVDELLELMKKTWCILGINKSIHNICFAWVLFEQYVLTGEVELDLLNASLSMLNEVASDAKKTDNGPAYFKILECILTAIKKWCDERLLDYHGTYGKGTIGLMENILSLVYSVKKMLEEEVPGYVSDDSTGNQVDCYIRSSMKNAFAKLLEDPNLNANEGQEVSDMLIQLATQTEELALKDKAIFSNVFKKWQPVASGVAALTLHSCYGTLLNKYLTRSSSSCMNGTILLLIRAGELEKVMLHMIVEESAECDGGKTLLKEIIPYEVDSIILSLLKQWIQERLFKGKEQMKLAQETETWSPKPKGELHAQSAEELIRISKEIVDDFFEIPLSVSEDLVYDIADGLEHLFQEYVQFVALCGSKWSFLPSLPPLTRCGHEPTFLDKWKKASCCSGMEDQNQNISNEGNNPRPSISRGTKRLWTRLNTLHYLISQLNSLDKTLSLAPNVILSPKTLFSNRRQPNSSYFDLTRSSIQASCQHISEVAAYRLIFLDSYSVFYGGLYINEVSKSRIGPTLRIIKQNLNLLWAMVTVQAQPLALKEVMKACFQAYLTVLLAGGNNRNFYRSDHLMIEEDLDNLKRAFSTCSEGLISDDLVEKESDIVKGVVRLMGYSSEDLIEDFNILVCEDSKLIGIVGNGKSLQQMPLLTSKWNWLDPNAMLRVLCYRKDQVANHFLKKTFQLPKRIIAIQY